MRDLIFKHIAVFVEMSPAQTVKITDQWFDRDYEKIAKEIAGEKTLAFNYLNTVL